MRHTLSILRLAVTGLFLTFAVQTSRAQTGGIWTPVNGLPITTWYSCAMSSNGVYGVATTFANLYVSSDSGTTWTLKNINLGGGYYNRAAIAATASGTMIGVISNGQVTFSTNLGATWTPTGIFDSSIKCSPDAKTWLAFVNGTTQISRNSGATWSAIAQSSTRMACSSDGTKIISMGINNVEVSTDSGSTWTSRLNLSDGSVDLADVAISGDGSTLIAASQYDATADPSYGTRGLVYWSTNGGTNWSVQNSFLSLWDSVAVSADGKTLAAVSQFTDFDVTPDSFFLGMLVMSTDGGTTWTLGPVPNQSWNGLCASSDGSTLLAMPLPANYPTLNIVAVPPYRVSFTPSPASAPSLGISTAGAAAYVTWPYPYPGYVLQRNSNLSGSNWIAVTNTPAIVSQVITTPTNANNFYRLAKP
jgi:hypothetical protein